MPTPTEELQRQVDRARSAGASVELRPKLSPEGVALFEGRTGTIPRDFQELLSYSTGFTLDRFGTVDFLGELPFEFEAIPNALPLATDAEGNFWVLDASRHSAWHPVFYILHDPPVALIQAPDLASFIGQTFDSISGATPQAISATHVKLISRHNPHVISRAQALATGDQALKAFAETLTDDFVLADLREEAPGSGFVWGLAGPNTILRRVSNDLIIATQSNAPSLVGRLLGLGGKRR